MIYPTPAQTQWQAGRWPSFRPREIACDRGACVFCGGEVVIDEASLDALQAMRAALGAPLIVTSGHRCAQHNRIVGGAAHSAHLELAFDLALERHDRRAMYAAAEGAGFRHIGAMKFGLHVDMRPAGAAAARWVYGPRSRELWRGIVPASAVDIGGD